MITYEDLTYLVEEDVSGDVFGSWINTSSFEEGVFTYWGLVFDDAGGNKFPHGYLEGSNDKSHVFRLNVDGDEAMK